MTSPLSPVTDALTSLVQAQGSSLAGSTEQLRSPMMFTSRFRQNILLEKADRISELVNRREQSRLEIAVNSGLGNNDLVVSQSPESLTKQIVDLNNQLEKAMPVITMALNPSSIEFDQPKRFARVDTMRGTDFHFFTNTKGENNDVLTIRFSGSTGDIHRVGKKGEDLHRANERLNIWHNLYALTREPELLSDGTHNTKTITYVSALFPIEIHFYGFFSKVLTFKEEGSEPRSREYSMEFTVQDTSPDLSTLVANIHDELAGETLAIPRPGSRFI